MTHVELYDPGADVTDVAAVLASLETRGVRVDLVGGRLRVRGRLELVDRERLRAYRDEIVAMLAGDAASRAPEPNANGRTRDAASEGIPEDALHEDEAPPATAEAASPGIDAGDEPDLSAPVELPARRLVPVRWPGASSPEETQARLIVKALAGRGERHADIELYLFDMPAHECRLPVTTGHCKLRAHAEGRTVDLDDLDAAELAAEYRATKAWLEELVDMLHRGELDERTLLVRCGVLRTRGRIHRLAE